MRFPPYQFLYQYYYMNAPHGTTCMEKKLDGKYTRMICAVLNKSWKQHRTKQQLYSHLPPISQMI